MPLALARARGGFQGQGGIQKSRLRFQTNRARLPEGEREGRKAPEFPRDGKENGIIAVVIVWIEEQRGWGAWGRGLWGNVGFMGLRDFQPYGFWGFFPWEQSSIPPGSCQGLRESEEVPPEPPFFQEFHEKSAFPYQKH